MSYDDTYTKAKDFFGAEPTPVLVEYAHLIDREKLVLDVGVGQGRNALHLARQGITVEGIDPSQVAVETVARFAAEENLPIKTHCAGFEDFTPGHLPYSAVLLFGIIQILSRDRIRMLVNRIADWTAAGSLAFISAFSIDDPTFMSNKAKLKPAGKNSFFAENRSVYTYLETDEILTLFDGWEVIHHHEGLGPWHRHGGKKPHRHANVIVVLRRQA